MTRSSDLRVADILDNIAFVRELIAGRDLAFFRAHAVERYALERALEIISEASRHLDDAFKASHPQIPWRAIADFGNPMRHEYFRISLDVVWSVASQELDALEAAVAPLRDTSRP